MSTDWIDTPGATISSTEPLDFTTTLDVIAVSVSFGSTRPEERVYRDGVFLYPYLRSTKSSLTFSLVRDGGWPGNPSVHVDEVTPAPTAGQTWGAIYSVDLTAQANQTLTTAGSYTVDGKAWWMKGTLWGSGVNTLVNGSGLRLFAPATLAGGSQPDRPNFRTVTTGITQRIVWFPVAQLADYNAAAPVYVEWRMSGTISGNSDRCYSAGIMTAANSSAAITNGERATCAQVCHHTFNSAGPILCGAAGSQSPTSTLNNNSALSAYRTGVQRFAKDRLYVIHRLTASDITPESTLDVSGSSASMEPAAQGAMGFYFTLHKAFSDGVTLDHYLTHLRVLQPKVP